MKCEWIFIVIVVLWAGLTDLQINDLEKRALVLETKQQLLEKIIK